MLVLVINAGSSSLKYQVIDTDTNKAFAKGLCEKVGAPDSFLKHGVDDDEFVMSSPIETHTLAVKYALNAIVNLELDVISSLDDIDAVGYRIVQGAEYFDAPTLIDEEVIQKIEDCAVIAPLHNKPAAECIRACRELMPDVPHVAVFDNAFHATMPPKAFMYPLPYEMYTNYHIRKYGAHGTSHRYVARRSAALLGRPISELKIITCHLGSGCSIAAIDRGVCVDTTMGFTPLDGLMMGTRSGSIDPAIIPYLMQQTDMTPTDVDELLNKRSGLLGISGISNDLRDIRDAAIGGHERAMLAYDMFAYSVKKHIGEFVFALAGTDVITVTAGVGENCVLMRRKIFEGLEPIGIILDQERNRNAKGECVISADKSRVKVLVIPTNEELMIAWDVRDLVEAEGLY